MTAFGPLTTLLLSAALLSVAASPSYARDRGRGGGDDRREETRAAATCSSGVSGRLRLRSRDGDLRVDFELKSGGGERWRLTLVRERRVLWRGTARTGRESRQFQIERSLSDLDGPDTVTVRGWGPKKRTCSATATLAGGS